MDAFQFGIHNGKLSRQECRRRDRICEEEGGYGYTQVNLPGSGWRGWFSGPNRGSPFDADLSRRVLERVERPRPVWEAETCLTGGYLCGHSHGSRAAAERCLPKVPRGPDFRGAFSMASVVAMNDAAEGADRARREEEERDR